MRCTTKYRCNYHPTAFLFFFCTPYHLTVNRFPHRISICVRNKSIIISDNLDLSASSYALVETKPRKDSGLNVSDGRGPKHNLRTLKHVWYQAFKPNPSPAGSFPGSPVRVGLGAALGTEDSSASSSRDAFVAASRSAGLSEAS